MKNKAKIVATLGPSSANKKTMMAMANAGVSVFRINFSHGDHSIHRKTIRLVKEINTDLNRNIAVLADLQGPKLRIGNVKAKQVLIEGNEIEFTHEDILGDTSKVYMNYSLFASDVKVGEKILLDDGKLALEIISTNKTNSVKAKVLQGGPLNSKKGVNLPNTKISLPSLTEKDLADLDVALEENIEWIGLSFVRSSTDVQELKTLIKTKGGVAKVVSKIEKPEAVKDIDNILLITDAAMVARGDLGVEVPMEEVPLIQKMIVDKCHHYSKPVIIATQMMETMIESLTPTRAEVNDVANSVLDGADAVMLSGETSVGKYPVEVVETMTKIISHIEDTAEITVKHDNPPVTHSKRFITNSICFNASKISDQIDAKAILTMSHSGYTAFQIASHRPKTNIIVFTANRDILNTLSLIWGVRAFFYDKMESTDQTFADIRAILKQKNIVVKDDMIVNIASMPIQDRGTTNMLKITQIK